MGTFFQVGLGSSNFCLMIREMTMEQPYAGVYLGKKDMVDNIEIIIKN